MINQSYPTPAEMEHILLDARALRAQTMRTGIRAIGHWIADLPHKFTAMFYKASHS